jgi:hypothetical protein
MNKATTIVALAAVTFLEGFFGVLVAAPILTDIDVSVLEAGAAAGGAAAVSVILNGLGDLHGYLAAKRNAA